MKKIFLLFLLPFILFAYQSEEEFLDEFSSEMRLEKRCDPLESYNRIMTSFNDAVYEDLLYPAAKGYKAVFHDKIRQSIDNAFYNVLYPKRVLNNILQGKLSNAFEESGYFLINSTLGVFGLFDVAKEQFELKSYNEDFGQTLGKWGAGSGFHIVIPFLGPSNVRDLAGGIPDYYVNYMGYLDHRNFNIPKNEEVALALKIYDRVNYTSLHLEDYKTLKKDAVDLYPYLRDTYEQYRNNQIKE